MKKIIITAIALALVSCDQLLQVTNQVSKEILEGSGGLTQLDIGNGLREALTNGVSNQVSKLTAENGFYGNDLVKIGLPSELKTVDETLRKLGMGSLADQGLKAINRTAEDAVKTAIPVFVDAIKKMSFDDAKKILTGSSDSATLYLKEKTSEKLYKKFNPIISESFKKVEADKLWSNLISKYNSIPLIEKVNPNLTDYVTSEALKGVFVMIEKEEKGIRTDLSKRNTDLLKRVFALQDNK